MTDGVLDKLNQKILTHVKSNEVCIENLQLDEIAKELFAEVNPFSLLRNSNDCIDDSSYLFNLLALHSPMFCYPFRKNYKVLMGILSLTKFQRAVQQNVLPQNYSIPVQVLSFKPSKEERKALIQYDLMTNMMACFTSDTKKISVLLHNIFAKDPDKASIYRSKEWSSLYPNIRTAKDLANYLSITEQGLVIK